MYWFVNASRSLVILITIVVVIYVADHLDRVVSIAGAIFGIGMDCWTFCEALGDGANEVMRAHWDEWLKEEHFK